MAAQNVNKTVYFISHVQADSKDVALEIFYSMKEKGKSCWLDVKMPERDEDAMKDGVKLCETVVIIMSPNYFTRPYCVKELEWAVELGKPIVVVIDIQVKGEIGNILSRCPADKSYLKGIGSISFVEVFRGNPAFWETSIQSILNAKPKILKQDGTVVKVDKKPSKYVLKKEQQQIELAIKELELEKERLAKEEMMKKPVKGTYTFDDGSVYTGDLMNGKPNGLGEIKYAEKDKYKRKSYAGEVMDGKPHGKGKKTWASGSVYEGDWKDGNQHGKGKKTFGKGVWKGDVYEGDYKDDKIHGNGKYTWADGRVYEGDWKDCTPHGKGKLTYTDGRVEDGQWQNGKFIG